MYSLFHLIFLIGLVGRYVITFVKYNWHVQINVHLKLYELNVHYVP